MPNINRSSTSHMISLLGVPQDLWVNHIIPQVRIQDIVHFELMCKSALALMEHFFTINHLAKSELRKALFFSKLTEAMSHIEDMLAAQVHASAENKIAKPSRSIISYIASFLPGGFIFGAGIFRTIRQTIAHIDLLAQQRQAFNDWLVTCRSDEARIHRSVCDDYSDMSENWMNHLMQGDCEQMRDIWNCTVESCLKYVGYCHGLLSKNPVQDNTFYYVAGAALMVIVPLIRYCCVNKSCQSEKLEQKLIKSFIQKNIEQYTQALEEQADPEQKKMLHRQLEEQKEILRVFTSTTELLSLYHLEYSSPSVIKEKLQEKIDSQKYQNNKMFLFQWAEEKKQATILDVWEEENESNEATFLLGGNA